MYKEGSKFIRKELNGKEREVFIGATHDAYNE